MNNAVYVKKIAELPLIEELSGEETVVVNDKGTMKQVLASKITPKETTDEETIEFLTQANIVSPVASNSGALFINNSGKIFII